MNALVLPVLFLSFACACMRKPDLRQYEVARINKIAQGTAAAENLLPCGGTDGGTIHPSPISPDGRLVAVTNLPVLEPTLVNTYFVNILAVPGDVSQAGEFTVRSQTRTQVELNTGTVVFRGNDELLVGHYHPVPWSAPDPHSATLESFAVDADGAMRSRVAWNPQPGILTGIDILHTDDHVIFEQLTPHQWVLLNLPHGSDKLPPESISITATLPILDNQHASPAAGALVSFANERLLISLEQQGTALRVWDISNPALPWLRSTQAVPPDIASPVDIYAPSIAADGTVVALIPNGGNMHIMQMRSDGLLEHASSVEISQLRNVHPFIALSGRRLVLHSPRNAYTVYTLDDLTHPEALTEHLDSDLDRFSFSFSPINHLIFTRGCTGFAAYYLSE